MYLIIVCAAHALCVQPRHAGIVCAAHAFIRFYSFGFWSVYDIHQVVSHPHLLFHDVCTPEASDHNRLSLCCGNACASEAIIIKPPRGWYVTMM